VPVRFAILIAYAAAMAFLGAVAASAPAGPEANCNLHPGLAHCVAGAYFDLFLRLAPIPAFVFLFADGRRRWTPGQCFGLSLLLFSLWRGVYFSFPNLLVIAGGGAVLGPTPAIEWYRDFFLKVLWDVVYPILGLFFVFRRVPGIHKPFTWGHELKSVLRPMGAWVKRSAALDAGWGAVLFPAFAIGSSVLATILAQGPTGKVGNDSHVFDEITLDLVFLLAIIAGVSEELVFRGFLLSALQRVLGPGKTSLSVAILVQAIAFALVHSGYAALDHLILPFLFGILAGLVYRLFGILAIMLVHAEIDVFAFTGSYVGPYQEALIIATNVLFLAQCAFAIVFLVFRVLTWRERRRKDRPRLRAVA
jgi:membrane protease YdiL (CAAX protease family)